MKRFLLSLLLCLPVLAQNRAVTIKSNGQLVDSQTELFWEMNSTNAAEYIGQVLGGVNVVSFGAIPDDGNDDYSAITNALAVAKAHKKETIFNQGTYNLSKRLELPNHAKLIGAGRSNTVLRLQNAAPVNATNETYPLIVQEGTNVSDIIIQGLHLDANAANQTNDYLTYTCIRLAGANMKILDCEFSGFQVGTNADECFVVGLTGDWQDTGTNLVSTIEVRNNIFHPPPNKTNSNPFYITGISVGTSSTNRWIRGVAIENNVFLPTWTRNDLQPNGINGIALHRVDGGHVTGNVFNRFWGKCYFQDSWQSRNIRIENNVMDTVRYGVHFNTGSSNATMGVASASNIVIANNWIKLAHADVDWTNSAEYASAQRGIQVLGEPNDGFYIYNNTIICSNSYLHAGTNVFDLYGIELAKTSGAGTMTGTWVVKDNLVGPKEGAIQLLNATNMDLSVIIHNNQNFYGRVVHGWYSGNTNPIYGAKYSILNLDYRADDYSGHLIFSERNKRRWGFQVGDGSVYDTRNLRIFKWTEDETDVFEPFLFDYTNMVLNLYNLNVATNATFNEVTLGGVPRTTWPSGGGGGSVYVNGVLTTDPNLTNSPTIALTVSSVTNVSPGIVVGSVGPGHMTNADFGAFTFSGGVATLDSVSLQRLGGIGTGTSGDVLYRDATGWTNLAKSSDGLVLKLTAGLPSWEVDNTGSGGAGLEYTILSDGNPASDNALMREHGTTGTNAQASVVLLSDSGAFTEVDSLTATNDITSTAGAFVAGATNLVGEVAGKQPLDAELTALAGVTSAADKVPYFTGSGTADVSDLSAFGRTLIDDVDNSSARTTLGLVIGTDVQAADTELTALAGTTSAADKVPYYTGSGTANTADLTATARSLLDDTSTIAMRTTLGVAIGSNVEAWDADLDALAGVSAVGMLARTGSGTASARTITGTANEIEVANGAGTAGNPTIGLPDNVTVTGNLTVGGTNSTTTVIANTFQFTNMIGTIPLTNGGTGYALTAPAADRLMFYDYSSLHMDWLTVGSGLTLSGTTISAVAGSGEPNAGVNLGGGDIEWYYDKSGVDLRFNTLDVTAGIGYTYAANLVTLYTTNHSGDLITSGTVADARIDAAIARITAGGTNLYAELAAKPNIADQDYQQTNSILTDIVTGWASTNLFGAIAGKQDLDDDLTRIAGASATENHMLVADSAGWTNVVSTGTGSPVRATSPTLVTPDIGAATGTSLTMGGTNMVGELAGKANAASPVLSGQGTTSGNIGALLSVGSTDYVDLNIASQTNSVSGAFTVIYATNGVDLVHKSSIRWFFNGSGSDQTLTIPGGWRTNVYSPVPPALTNASITKMIVESAGPTGDAASQTNCYVSFEYFK